MLALARRTRLGGSIEWHTTGCGGTHYDVTDGDANPAGHLLTLFRSHSGADTEQNLITLCAECHGKVHSNSCPEATSQGFREQSGPHIFLATGCVITKKGR